MKKMMLVVIVVPLVAVAETQSQCISRVKQAMAACGEVCDEIMSTKASKEKCYKACGEEARAELVDECKVPLKR